MIFFFLENEITICILNFNYPLWDETLNKKLVLIRKSIRIDTQKLEMQLRGLKKTTSKATFSRKSEKGL